MRNRGLAFKLILFCTLGCGFVFLLVFGYSYLFARHILEKNMEEQARNLTVGTVSRIEAQLRAVRKVPEGLAIFLETGTYDKSELLQVLLSSVDKSPEIYGSIVAFEPHAFEKGTRYFAPYFYKLFGFLNYSDLGKEFYHYLYTDWYQIPKEVGHAQWTEPYFAETGNEIMATYSVPFYRKRGGARVFSGIVTSDVSLQSLTDLVLSVKILQTGYAFLLSQNGTIVTHPIKELIMNETIFGVAEARADNRLREIGRRMISGETGFVSFTDMVTHKECLMFYAPIPTTSWSLAMLFPHDEFVADVVRLKRTALMAGAAGLFLLGLAVAFVARSVTRPLENMVEATGEIARGNLDVDLPEVAGRDEVAKLTESFREMKTSLKDYIARLTETTAAKERMESELKIAHDIQMSILPKVFPPFPDRPQVDIFAFIEPAREVGGDFYDFFEVDEEHILFVIADVSGKGIPASLFMAVTKTLIKAVAFPGRTPGAILGGANKEICAENESTMFVTVFVGLMNTRTGEVLYSCGGHNPPLLVRRGGEVSWIRNGKGPLLGIVEEAFYPVEKLILEAGDRLFLYTDGVTEAMNGREELFSEGRLSTVVTRLAGRSIEETIVGVKSEISEFCQGAPQSDDITMLAIEFKGP